jgi:serralysin
LTSVKVATNKGETLAADQEGQVVIGSNGAGTLSSSFNRTALVGGNKADQISTDVVVPIDGTDPVRAAVVQSGAAGADTLTANVKLVGSLGPYPRPSGESNIWVDGGAGSDTIRVEGSLEEFNFSAVRIVNTVFGGSGDDDIVAIADSTHEIGDQFVMNIVDGGSGDDHIVATGITEFNGYSTYAYNNISGGDGRDVIEASVWADSNRTIETSNTLHGGRGDDIPHADNPCGSSRDRPIAANYLYGADGEDVLVATHSGRGATGTNATNHFDGGNGNDSLTASSVSQVAQFATVRNELLGGNGSDVLTADITATSNDTLIW